MSTTKLYLEDSNLFHTHAVVTAVGVTDDGRPGVRLDRTIFHAQGGGQRADRGRIGQVAVLHAAHAAGGAVDHVVESHDGLSAGAPVEIAIDPDWRRLNTLYHSGGHLIAAVVEAAVPALRAVAGHHWPGEARVEFEGEPKPALADAAVLLREELTRMIMAAISVRVVGAPDTDRSIQIGDCVPVPCGGTHVASTAELAGIVIDKIRTKGGRFRVSYSLRA